jgi:F-type H+-transporting ATPase subunit c
MSAQLLASGLATISILGSGIGIGVIFGSLLIGSALNPRFKDDLFSLALLGFALTEAVALFGLMMAFLLLYGSY